MYGGKKIQHRKKYRCLKNLKSNLKCLEAAYITLKTDPEKSIIQKQCVFSNEFNSKSFYCVLDELRYYGQLFCGLS